MPSNPVNPVFAALVDDGTAPKVKPVADVVVRSPVPRVGAAAEDDCIPPNGKPPGCPVLAAAAGGRPGRVNPGNAALVCVFVVCGWAPREEDPNVKPDVVIV